MPLSSVLNFSLEGGCSMLLVQISIESTDYTDQQPRMPPSILITYYCLIRLLLFVIKFQTSHFYLKTSLCLLLISGLKEPV